MDQWDFKKWRKKHGNNKGSAGEMPGRERRAAEK